MQLYRVRRNADLAMRDIEEPDPRDVRPALRFVKRLEEG